MAVGSPLQWTGKEGKMMIFSTQRQLQICDDANHCRSPLDVHNVLKLVVIWGVEDRDRFPTRYQMNKIGEREMLSANLERNDETSFRPLVYHRF